VRPAIAVGGASGPLAAAVSKKTGIAMNGRSWIEMPVSDRATPGDPIRPRYAIEGSALLVYRGERVYVALDELDVIHRISQLPDVHRLSADEAASFEATLPGSGAFANHGHMGPNHHAEEEKTNEVGLGDVVSWLTNTLGIHECSACSERKKKLNKLTIWRSAEG
jgi:hypothetical protein